MAKVLVIRKTDKTIHKSAIENKAALMAHNNRLPQSQKWKIEEMDEEEADQLPFIDTSYVTAFEAQNKVKELEGASAEKDDKIKELEARLAALTAVPPAAPTLTGPETIAKIEAATTADEVNAILGADTRKTVQDAAAKKLASF